MEERRGGDEAGESRGKHQSTHFRSSLDLFFFTKLLSKALDSITRHSPYHFFQLCGSSETTVMAEEQSETGLHK